MKNIALSMILVFAFFNVSGQSKRELRKFKKDSIASANYGDTKMLVQSKNYEFKGDWMYPLGGNRISLIGNMNKLTVKENEAIVQLPFYGVKQFASGGNPGINFKGSYETYEVDYNDEEYTIEVNFKVVQNTSSYLVTLRINSNGSARVNIASYTRNSISYSGRISTIETANK